MLTKIKFICISLSIIPLSACMTMNGSGNYNHSQPNEYQMSPLYPEGYENTVIYSNNPYALPSDLSMSENNTSGKPAATPIASKDVDKTWVFTQNPASYTIRVSENEKASQVARTLQNIPKNERTAEVKSQQNGKVIYQGLYGSYPSQDAANNALNQLPQAVKQGATVETWSAVQQSIAD